MGTVPYSRFLNNQQMEKFESQKPATYPHFTKCYHRKTPIKHQNGRLPKDSIISCNANTQVLRNFKDWSREAAHQE